MVIDRAARVFPAVCLLACLVGCSTDPEHPTTAEALDDYRPSRVVGKVDGRPIGAAEAREAASEEGLESPEDVAKYLEERELLVSLALGDGVEVEAARKQAMVRAYLEDVIEREVTADSVADDKVEPYMQAARNELARPRAFVTSAFRIAPLPLINRDPGTSPERAEELLAISRARAQELYDRFAEDPSPERFEEFELSSVQAPLRADVDTELHVADPDSQNRPKGWVSVVPLWLELEKVEDGELTPIVQSGPMSMFALRREQLEEVDPTDEEVRRQATEAAVTAARIEAMEELLERLRSQTATAKYPQALKEEHQLQ